jgi:hypothetical protein
MGKYGRGWRGSRGSGDVILDRKGRGGVQILARKCIESYIGSKNVNPEI